MARMQMGLLRSEAFNSAYTITSGSLFTDRISSMVFAGDSLFCVGPKFTSGENFTAQIARMNAVSGEVFWVRSVSGTIGSSRVSIAACSDGDVVVAFTSAGNAEVMRVAPDGSIVWQRVIDATHSINPDTPNWLAVDSSNDVYLVLPGSSGNQTIDYVKLVGSTGLTSYNRRYSSTAVDHIALSCAVTPGGQLVIGAVKGTNDHLLLLTDTDGTINTASRVNDSGSSLNVTGKGPRGIDVGTQGNILVAWGWNSGARLTGLSSVFAVQWTREWPGIEFVRDTVALGTEDELFILGAEDVGADNRAWLGSVDVTGVALQQRYVSGTDSREVIDTLGDITRSFLVVGGSDSGVESGVGLKIKADLSNAVAGNGVTLIAASETMTSPTVSLTADGGTGSVQAVTNTAGSRTLTNEAFTTNLLS